MGVDKIEIELKQNEVSLITEFAISRISFIAMCANPKSKTFELSNDVVAAYFRKNDKAVKSTIMKFVRHYKSLKYKP